MQPKDNPSHARPGATITLPAEIVPELREGTCLELQRASDALSTIAARPGHLANPDWYQEHLRDFDAARALLDEIGWANTEPPVESQVDLHRHGAVVLAALRAVYKVAEYALEDVGAGRQQDPVKRRTMSARVERLRTFLATVEGQLMVREDVSDEPPMPDPTSEPG